MTASPKIETLTVDEFLQRYPNDEPFELLEGEILAVPPPKFTQGNIAALLLSYLAPFVRDRRLGYTTTDVGFRLSETTLIAPDLCFISRERYAQVDDVTEYFPFAPDLAVEVVSPSNSANEMASKVRAYLKAGASLVWVIYPLLGKVEVHRANHTAYDVSVGDTLTGGDLLPGLSIPVADLFPPDQSSEAQT